MTAKGGRPRTFRWGVVPAAIESHQATGKTWKQIAVELGVPASTLRTRAAEYLRLRRSVPGLGASDRRLGVPTGAEDRVRTTPVSPTEELPPPIRSSGPGGVEIVLETYRPPRLCSLCGMVHSPEVPCP